MRDNDGPARGWNLLNWRWFAEPPVGFAAAVWGILLIVFLLIAVSGVLALFQLLAPIWGGASAPANSPAADPGAELRGRLLVIGALLTSPFLVWRLVVSHWSARAAQEQARIAQETARNSLFTSAIEQLGATREEKKTTVGQTGSRDESSTKPNTEVRLGAIYALEKLARDDLQMHWPIMETLCAYVRQNAGAPQPLPDHVVSALATRWDMRQRTPEEQEALESLLGLPEKIGLIPVDVQAALTVVGRRSKAQRDFEQESRSKSSAAMRKAWRLNLTRCHLPGANLAGLNFKGALLDATTLYFADCSNTNFEAAILTDVHLEGAQLAEANFRYAWLKGTHLEGAWLPVAHLEFANLESTHLEGALLGQANFRFAILGQTNLTGSILRKADFEFARIIHARFDRAQFENAITVDAFFDGVDLSTVKNLDQSQLEAMWGNDKIQLPPGLTTPVNERWFSESMGLEAMKDREQRWNTPWKEKFELLEKQLIQEGDR